jgi:diguanylate cyclase (GGDEF)-like protein
MEQELANLRREKELLQQRLYDSVSQNLRLLSILELSRPNQEVISAEESQALLCRQIQEAIGAHRLVLIIAGETQWRLLRIAKESAKISVTEALPETPDLAAIKAASYISGDDKSVLGLIAIAREFMMGDSGDGRATVFPLVGNPEARALGYFVLFSHDKALSSEELRLLEACQKQVAQMLHVQHLYELSNIDSLTGLFTRRYTEAKLRYEMRRSTRRHEDLAVLLLDIDFFKNINDTYGHLLGDKTLKAVGALLASLVRDIDVAGRIGGEEFLLVLPGTENAGAQLVAERIRSRLERMTIGEQGANINITVSIGAAIFDSNRDQEIGDLLDRADKALYGAKANGRNRVVFAS